MLLNTVKRLFHCRRHQICLSINTTNNFLRASFCDSKSTSNQSSSDVKNSNESERKQTTSIGISPRITQRQSSESVADLLQNATSMDADELQPKSESDVWTTPIYPSSALEVDKKKKRREEGIEKPKIDPRETCVILFPGQGTQFVGMGEEVIQVPNVKQMYECASDILGYDLLQLCLKGPKENLDKTQYCQPAIFVTSLAAVERLRYEKPGVVETCVATAGFSVGELAALVFAGSLTFEDALRLVKIRAEAMQYASELTPSGMMTIFYGPDAKVKFACRAASEWCIQRGMDVQHAVCSVANYLFPHCKVIAGHDEALKFIEMNGKEFGIRRIKRLPVSGAFHTKLMKPAKEVFREAMKKVNINNPLVCVHANVTGNRYYDSNHIRAQLTEQICAPVKWEQTMHSIYARSRDVPSPKTYECGPGNTLLTMLRMVNGPADRQAHHIRV